MHREAGPRRLSDGPGEDAVSAIFCMGPGISPLIGIAGGHPLDGAAGDEQALGAVEPIIVEAHGRCGVKTGSRARVWTFLPVVEGDEGMFVIDVHGAYLVHGIPADDEVILAVEETVSAIFEGLAEGPPHDEPGSGGSVRLDGNGPAADLSETSFRPFRRSVTADKPGAGIRSRSIEAVESGLGVLKPAGGAGDDGEHVHERASMRSRTR